MHMTMQPDELHSKVYMKVYAKVIYKHTNKQSRRISLILTIESLMDATMS